MKGGEGRVKRVRRVVSEGADFKSSRRGAGIRDPDSEETKERPPRPGSWAVRGTVAGAVY